MECQGVAILQGGFENAILSRATSRRPESSVPLMLLPRSSSGSFAAVNSVHLPFGIVRTYGDNEDLAKQLALVVPGLSPGHPVLFVPETANEATFDAF
jgi:hypothetical protein